MANNTKIKGSIGEKLAHDYLISKGYFVIEKNYRCSNGEIDLICKKGDYTIFIEVKYRRTTSFGLPKEAVNLKKQQKIKITAMHYINEKQLINTDFRFDVIEIIHKNDIKINHIKNAFC